MNEINVRFLENKYYFIKITDTQLSTGTVQDVMPLVLHSIQQLNHSEYNTFLHQQTITFYTSFMRM